MKTRDLIGPKYPPGMRVRLTGQFLKATGQQSGGEGERVWTVEHCECELCKSLRFVAVDEVLGWTDEDASHLRHMAISNICGEHELTIRNDP